MKIPWKRLAALLCIAFFKRQTSMFPLHLCVYIFHYTGSNTSTKLTRKIYYVICQVYICYNDLHSFFISMVYFLLSLSMLRKKPFSASKYAEYMLAYRKGTPRCSMQQTTAFSWAWKQMLQHGDFQWAHLPKTYEEVWSMLHTFEKILIMHRFRRLQSQPNQTQQSILFILFSFSLSFA